MDSPLQSYAADHRYLMDRVARQAGFTAPVAIDLGSLESPLLRVARKREMLPVDGVLVRHWDSGQRGPCYPGIAVGLRFYEIEDIRFVRVCAILDDWQNQAGYDFYAVERADYLRLYRIAVRCSRHREPASPCPVLPAEQAQALWQNTIGYLEPDNLKRIKAYGGRPKRGVLLTGPPGNGKTMACRWVWEECRLRGWEWRLVTPDAYRAARESCNPVRAVQELFSVDQRGIVFFDDMDMALRDRETVKETDDQAVFLGAMDGISVHEGVVFVFTTNCDLALIDRAFKRPGRLDLVLQFRAPDAELRRQLVRRWHADILQTLNVETVIASTDGYSFAEIEELKNLLILHLLDTGRWDWGWALEQFDSNRQDLNRTKNRVGFVRPDPVETLVANGI
jgi:cell division protease FtsH